MSKTHGIMAGWLLVSKDRVLQDHALVCEDGVITDIVPNAKVAGDTRFDDARGHIVSPGFINTHSHMYNVIIRGKNFHAKAHSLKAMLEEYWWAKVEDRVNHEIIDISTRFSCVDMLKNGITCLDDILEAPNSLPGCLALEADIVEKAGMRAVLSLESCERISPENGMACLEENRNFIQRQREARSLVRGMMCVHTTFSCSAGFLRAAKAMARALDGSIQLHCSEGPDESRWCYETHGKLPMELYEEAGFLDSDVLASQCVIMDPAELSLMAKRGVRVSHQPISNSSCGCGVAPVPDMLRLGLTVGVGTDGEDNDMLEVLRTAYMLHRAKRVDPRVITVQDLFMMSTEMGARAVRYDGIGTLEVGKPDISLIIAEQPSRGLDIASTEYVHQCLIEMRNKGKSVLLITADLDELFSVSDRIAVLYNGQFVAFGKADEFPAEKLGLYMTGGTAG